MANNTSPDSELRKQLITRLRADDAHIDFEHFVADLSPELAMKKIPNVPYTIWQVLEHMRIAQWDIVEFALNPNHESPTFPDGYWPSINDVPDQNALASTINSFRSELSKIQEAVANKDLLAPIPHANGQTMLRQALLLADHNAYHLGALVVMKRILTGTNR